MASMQEASTSMKGAKKALGEAVRIMDLTGSQELADSMSGVVNAVGTVSAIAEISASCLAIHTAWRGAQAAEAGVLTGIFAAMGPVGWSRIAIAGGAAAIAGGVACALTSATLRGDLSCPTDVQSIKGMLA